MSPTTALPAALRRTFRAATLALRSWTPRQHVAALGFAVVFAALLGIPTVLIPNPVFGREVPPQPWSYATWVLSSVLAGMLAATYVRPTPVQREPVPSSAPVVAAEGGSLETVPAATDRPGRWGMAGGALTWFAVGCPVCNKLALLALGYAGTMRWFAPAQPVLAVAAVAMTAGALVVRLRGQVLCSVAPAVRAGGSYPSR